MSSRTRILALCLVAGLAACEPEGSADPAAHEHADVRTAREAPGYERDLAALRAAVSGLQDRELAAKAGWDTFITPCLSDAAGAMGFHVARMEYLGDGILSVTTPEALLFEPQSNGRLRLVGVEYILPGEPTDDPPVLFGQEFAYVPAFEVWGLHVWPWLDNPNGLFAPWNPRVSCAHADKVDVDE